MVQQHDEPVTMILKDEGFAGTQQNDGNGVFEQPSDEELRQARGKRKTSSKIRKPSRRKIRKPSMRKIREAVEQGLTQKDMASQWKVSMWIVRKLLRETPNSGYVQGKRGKSAVSSTPVQQAGPRETLVDIKTAFSGIKEQRASLTLNIERITEELAAAQERIAQYDKEVLEGLKELGIYSA